MTGLIGFGGEGKSSLARRWLDNLLADQSWSRPDGVFWWGFYEKRSIDEFCEAALAFVTGGRLDSRRVPSTHERVQAIGAALRQGGRYLFVLDGLEVLQYEEGNEYGLLASPDMREVLTYLAAPWHQSFCLITSRAPVLDLLAYTTYTHRDVDRLSRLDGRALLRNFGVEGPDAALDRVVEDWDGHALTLSLLGAYAVARHGGDVTRIDEVPPPTADEPRYERVRRVLQRYDEHLTVAERAFLMLFSAFRVPVNEGALARVFRAEAETGPVDDLTASVATLDDAQFEAMLRRLHTYRILRYDWGAHQYTAHPLIRAHYSASLDDGDPTVARAAHGRIKEYYLGVAGETPRDPTLSELTPLIEAVHHACRAGAYDEAERVRWERVQQQKRHVLTYRLGAYDTELTLLLDFFPGGDISGEPQVSSAGDKDAILNEVARCLVCLGHPNRALQLYRRSLALALKWEDWQGASISYQNLAEASTLLGMLRDAMDSINAACELAHRSQVQKEESDALASQAHIAGLRGDLETARTAFRRAETLLREAESDKGYLYSGSGCEHADYLRRIGEVEYARRITEANLTICERHGWRDDLSRCYRLLGDLDATAIRPDSDRVQQHYDEAVRLARSISVRDVLLDALSARGRWAARRGDVEAARADLQEALGYARAGRYRVHEADIRVGLGWAHRAAGDASAARAAAQQAHRMSAEMGYHWGQAGAKELLADLDRGGGDVLSA